MANVAHSQKNKSPIISGNLPVSSIRPGDFLCYTERYLLMVHSYNTYETNEEYRTVLLEVEKVSSQITDDVVYSTLKFKDNDFCHSVIGPDTWQFRKASDVEIKKHLLLQLF